MVDKSNGVRLAPKATKSYGVGLPCDCMQEGIIVGGIRAPEGAAVGGGGGRGGRECDVKLLAWLN